MSFEHCDVKGEKKSEERFMIYSATVIFTPLVFYASENVSLF